MTQQHAASIKDVAEYAEVAISTVSNVLNGTKPVSDELRIRVLAAVEKTGYKINMVARGLKSGHTNVLSVIVPSITRVFFPVALRGMQQAAAEAGYSISIYETQEDPAVERRCIEVLKNQWVDGIVLGSCVHSDEIDYFRELAALNVNGRPLPVVGFESSPCGLLDAVVVDNYGATKLITEHLLSRGCKRIAHISGPMQYAMSRERRAGYIAALTGAGFSIDESMIREGDFDAISGYMCLRALLARRPLPDAVVCANDQSAVGAIRAVQDAGLSVPRDIAVTGFDNSFPSTLISPAITTISVPREQMGRATVDLLLKRIRTGSDALVSVLTLDAPLVVRGSSDVNVQSQWELRGW